MTTVPTGTAAPRRRTRGGGGLRAAPYLFLAPFVVLFLVFLVLPIFIALYKSFFAVQRSGLGFGGGEEAFVGFGNYVQAFGDSAFVESFGRVLLYGVVQVPIMLAIAIGLALLFDSAVVRGKRFFQLSVFLPYAVPSVVAALVWGFLYQPRVSPIVEGLRSLGMDPQFLAPGTVLWSLANVGVWSVTGVNMIIIFSSLQTVPREMYEAARMDGASELRLALQIKLPQMQVSAIATTVDGRREVLLRDANNPQNTASMQYPRGVGDPAVQFSVGQTVNFEPAGNEQGWQLRDNQGRPLEYLPEATGPRDIFDTRR